MQIKKRIEYNVEHNYLNPEFFKGAYDLLAQNLLLTSQTWISQQILRNKSIKEELYKKALWAMLYPNFSKKGVQEFDLTIAPFIL